MKLKLKQLENLELDVLFKNIVGTAPNQTVLFNGTNWVVGIPTNSSDLQNVLQNGNESTTVGALFLKKLRLGYGKYVGGSENRTLAIGNKSLESNLEGNNIISIGNEALYSNEYGSNLIAIGYSAGRSVHNTTDNIYIGTKSAYKNKGGNNIIVGHNSLESEDSTNLIVIGNNIKSIDKNNYLAIGVSDDNILIEGDFLNKTLSVNAKLIVKSNISQVVKRIYTTGYGEILVRNKTNSNYEVLESAPNQVIITDGDNKPRYVNLGFLHKQSIVTLTSDTTILNDDCNVLFLLSSNDIKITFGSNIGLGFKCDFIQLSNNTTEFLDNTFHTIVNKDGLYNSNGINSKISCTKYTTGNILIKGDLV